MTMNTNSPERLNNNKLTFLPFSFIKSLVSGILLIMILVSNGA